MALMIILMLSGCVDEFEVIEDPDNTTTSPYPPEEPTNTTIFNISLNDAYIEYDHDYTTVSDIGQGYGKGLITVANTGTGEVEITSIKAYWATSFTEEWTEITDATSIQGITVNDPWVVGFSAIDDLSIRFPIPTENINNSLSYKIILTPREGRTLDTSKTDGVEETDMQLDADRPDISYASSLGNIRRTKTISPNSVTDNSVVKNVTFEVFDDFSDLVEVHTITSTSVWNWNWNTINSTTQGLDNGTYTMKMTVYDYAGLSDFVDNISFTIDNDYIAPTIGGLWLTDPYSESQTAEVGERAYFTVNINDTGTIEPSASIVDTATLYYRINDSIEAYSTVIMGRYGVTNNWTTFIPSGFVGSTALEEGIECYVLASDYDGNSANSSGNLKKISVDDHYKPDISHIPITTASVASSYINITATITDEDQVNETTVRLYYRQTDDYGGVTESWNSIIPNIAGNEYSWLIWSTDITIHGLDYYFNATDRFSGHVAYEGNETDPNHITIPDEQTPVITHAEIPTATNDTALDIDCSIFDNDPTFGAEGSETGTVTVYYRDYDGGGAFLSTSMSRISGNSSIDSNGETPSTTVWSGTVPASAIDDDGDPRLDYYITARDQTMNLAQDGVPFHITTVLPQGEPNLLYVADSAVVSGSIGEEVVITVENMLGSGTDAEIGRLNLTIYKDGGFGTDIPELTLTKFASTTVWSDASGVSNNTWVTFSTNHTIVEGTTADITLTFENSSNQPYDMHDLTFLLVLEAYSDFDTTSTHEITLDLPAGGETKIEKRYMTISYLLLTVGTISAMEEKGSQIESSFEWGIRVYVGGKELTTQLEAIVYAGGADSWVERQGTWNCPQTTLSPTDSVTIAIIARAGAAEQTLAIFSTGALGATELSAATWSINYWIRWKDQRRGNEPYFGFGDVTSFDSFVDNFTYITGT